MLPMNMIRMQALAARSLLQCGPRFCASSAPAASSEAKSKEQYQLQFEMNPPAGVETITLFLRPVPRAWRDEGRKTHNSMVMGVYNQLLKSFGPIYAPTWLKKGEKKVFTCLFFNMEREAGLRAISEINGKVPVPGKDEKFNLTEAIRKKSLPVAP
jgi:hypothetical protein